MKETAAGARTKQLLTDSLRHLMEKKPLNQISVKEITDGCGMQRQTFYYHFPDIFGLLVKMGVSAANRRFVFRASGGILAGKPFAAVSLCGKEQGDLQKHPGIGRKRAYPEGLLSGCSPVCEKSDADVL